MRRRVQQVSNTALGPANFNVRRQSQPQAPPGPPPTGIPTTGTARQPPPSTPTPLPSSLTSVQQYGTPQQPVPSLPSSLASLQQYGTPQQPSASSTPSYSAVLRRGQSGSGLATGDQEDDDDDYDYDEYDDDEDDDEYDDDELSGSGLVKWLGSRGRRQQERINREDDKYARAAREVYDTNRFGIGPYRYEPSFSNAELAVWKDESNREIIIAFRGSTTAGDWSYTDTMLARGLLTSSFRFSRDLKAVKQIIAQHPDIQTFVMTGHSLGGSEAIEIVKKLHLNGRVRAVTFNAGSTIGFRTHHNLPIRFYHYKNDAVSALGVNKFKDSITIDKGDKKGYIAAHSMDNFVEGPKKEIEETTPDAEGEEQQEEQNTGGSLQLGSLEGSLENMIIENPKTEEEMDLNGD